MKILITDDEYATRSSIKHLVTWRKFSIDTILEAESFDEAVIKIIDEEPEIIILDIIMPSKNGIHLMEWITSHSPDSKVIAVSGHDDYDYVRKIMKYGGVDYLLKPLDIRELNNAVSKAVDLYQQESEEREKTKEKERCSELFQNKTSCHHVIKEVVKYLDENYTSKLNQEDLAEKFFISKEYLSRKFKSEFGINMVDYINQLRIQKAQLLMESASLKLFDIAYKVGFQDEKYFSRVFKKVVGISPKEFRKKLY